MKCTWFPKDRTGNYGKGVCCPDSLVFNKEVGYCVSKPVCQYFEYPLNSKIWYPNQYQQNSNQAICQNSFDISGNDASRNSYLKDMCTTGNAIIKPPVCSNYGQNFKCGIEVQDYVVNNGTVANKGFNFVFTKGGICTPALSSNDFLEFRPDLSRNSNLYFSIKNNSFPLSYGPLKSANIFEWH